ncbi:MAG: hypothetical protein ABSD62_02675 [Candidatus Limnocylindrales bacterium]|jgi:hypothetical protein
MSNKVLAVLKPVLTDLGADDDPACWVLWGEDPEFRYSVMAPTPAGLITVAIRVSGGAEGPRATGKLVRWGKLQVTELGVESTGGHRIVATQIEGQVLKGTDEEADQICEFVLGLLAGIDGRAYQAVGPVVLQAVPQAVLQAVPQVVPQVVPPAVSLAKPAVVKPEAPKVGAKPGLKAVPTPAAAPAGTAKEAASQAAEGAPAAAAADQAPARKPARTPSGKARPVWVAPHPIGLPAPKTPTPVVAPPAAKPEAPKRPAVPAAHPAAQPAAAARAGEPAEGAVWEVPEPSEREAKRPRTWTP